MFSLKGAKKKVETKKLPSRNVVGDGKPKNVFKSELNSDSESDDEKKTSIESFSKDEPKKPKIIRPSELVSTITNRKIPEEREGEDEVEGEDEGEEEDYDVPVEEFGAAMLRGMGWNSKNSRKVTKPNIEKRKQGLLLGIGAKSVDDDIAQELLSSKAKFTIPLVKRDKKTGEIIRD